MTDTALMHRRHFITLSATASGALLLQFPLVSPAAAAQAQAAGKPYITGFFEIAADNQLILQLNRHEMGQGLSDGLRTLFAEELNTAPEHISVRLMSVGPDQPNRQALPQNTGGSQSMRSSWVPVRQAAAYCREVLLRAATLMLKSQGKPLPVLELRDGWILGPREPLRFAAVAGFIDEAVKSVDLNRVKPRQPPWNYIGGWNEPAWQKEKIRGTAKYGYDRACTLVASIERPVRIGATLASMDEKAALAIKGVTRVVPLQAGVAVVANNTWAALQGRKALQAQWTGGAEFSSEAMLTTLTALLDKPGVQQAVVNEGATPAGTAALERQYLLPMLAHTPLEPLSCTVSVTSKYCQILAGVQQPEAVRTLASRVTGLPLRAIQFSDELSGGSFGRRIATDFIAEALELGMKLRQQVKVVWTREDQLGAGHYRPPAAIRVRGFAGANGALSGVQYQIASPARLWPESAGTAAGSLLGKARELMGSLRQNVVTPVEHGNGVRASSSVGGAAVGGISDAPYRLAHRKVEHVPVELPVPMAYWRSVGNTLNTFALETFLDEWALQHKIDPIDLRLRMLPTEHRLRPVLARAAELASWHQRAPENALGVACFSGYGSHVATIVRLQPNATHPGQIAEIICAVDCGTVINPDNVRAQVEGSIQMGLSAALREQVVLEKGQVTSRNFDSYRLLDIAQSPSTYIELILSEEAPGGIGEPAVPPVAPALVNAWRLRSGENIASLPVMAHSKGQA